jgi:hypothetical protein
MGPTALLPLRWKCGLRIFITHKNPPSSVGPEPAAASPMGPRGKRPNNKTTEGGNNSDYSHLNNILPSTAWPYKTYPHRTSASVFLRIHATCPSHHSLSVHSHCVTQAVTRYVTSIKNYFTLYIHIAGGIIQRIYKPISCKNMQVSCLFNYATACRFIKLGPAH